MKARLLVAGSALVVFCFPASAGAFQARIFPGLGIGKIRLDMNAGDVKKALGSGYVVNKRETIGGARYVELAWDYSAWNVKFVRRGATLRVVQVSTGLRSEKTAKGVGPGTMWPKLVRTYPGGQCTFGNPFGSGALGIYLEYLVPHRTGTQTIFVLQGVADKNDPTRRVGFRVLDVRVRKPYLRLPEFARGYPRRCAEGWQQTATPEPR